MKNRAFISELWKWRSWRFGRGVGGKGEVDGGLNLQ